MRELVRAHTQVRGSPSAHAGRCEHALSCEAARERAPRVAVPEPRRSGGVTVTGLWVGSWVRRALQDWAKAWAVLAGLLGDM